MWVSHRGWVSQREWTSALRRRCGASQSASVNKSNRNTSLWQGQLTNRLSNWWLWRFPAVYLNNHLIFNVFSTLNFLLGLWRVIFLCLLGNITLTEAMFEQNEGCKLSDAEAVAHIKNYPINCAKSGTGKNEDAVFTEWMFCAANHIVTKIASDPECVKILVALEGQYRLKSCLNSAAKLEKLATKPNGKDARRWVFQCLWDRLQHKLLDNNEVSRNALVGDKHSAASLCCSNGRKSYWTTLDQWWWRPRSLTVTGRLSWTRCRIVPAWGTFLRRKWAGRPILGPVDKRLCGSWLMPSTWRFLTTFSFSQWRTLRRTVRWLRICRHCQ